MKITVRPKEKVEEKVTVDDTMPGCVFKFRKNKVIALKLYDDKIFLLNYSTGESWLEISKDDSLGYNDIEILGRLDEIIVVKE